MTGKIDHSKDPVSSLQTGVSTSLKPRDAREDVFGSFTLP